MYRLAFGMALLFFLIIFFVEVEPTLTAKYTPTPTITPSPTPYMFSENKLFNLVQEWKYRHDGYRYIESDLLCSIANKRLEETSKDWSHSQFNKYFDTFNYIEFGENLARRHKTESLMFSSWLNSKSHRENLDKAYTHSCIKCENSENRCVQLFAIFN